MNKSIISKDWVAWPAAVRNNWNGTGRKVLGSSKSLSERFRRRFIVYKTKFKDTILAHGHVPIIFLHSWAFSQPRFRVKIDSLRWPLENPRIHSGLKYIINGITFKRTYHFWIMVLIMVKLALGHFVRIVVRCP